MDTTIERLISDSVSILREKDNIDIVYGWSDLGDLICEKQRLNAFSGTLKPLTKNEVELINNLTNIIKRVKLENYII